MEQPKWEDHLSSETNSQSHGAVSRVWATSSSGSVVGAVVGALLGSEASGAAVAAVDAIDEEDVLPMAKALPLTGAAHFTPEQVAFLEQQLPDMARAATQSAFWNALTRGERVVYKRDDEVVEVAPDGATRVLKTLPPGVSLAVGTELDAR